ncbi:LysR family transcriptional regulator [Pollutimonas bauzanensis]|uniref:DNA-binding transcriptional regulator, LysR family n=1 Tax=Pollutimonas bauzanensis TaxID=658167 RepID=A0A1M5PW06_9BURK|nr:LysR family transcriptional regulator [Pollutimonas bauzanensis]SHH05691.1 DNA-binding transcriptional regulator, LysR family [Pollutimonas bauzanensis]
MSINFKLLNAFMLVAECGTLRMAAEKANRSLPAISMQIKRLEEQLGTHLFHRTSRKLELTSTGEQLLTYVRRAFLEMDQGLLQLKQTINLQQGKVSIACSPTVATTRLPAILSGFARQYPGIRLYVQELSLVEQLESIEKCHVDFSIGPAPHGIAPHIQFDPVLRDEIYALLPATYAQAKKSVLTLAEFSRFPALMLSSDSGLRPMMDEALRTAGLVLQMRCEAKQISTLIAMVRSGMGAALLPRIALHENLGKDLVALRITEPNMARELGILTAKGRSPTSAASQLQRMVHQLLAPMGAESVFASL